MCPLQIINDIEPLSLMMKITWLVENSQPKKVHLSYKFFYTFMQIFGRKFEIPIATEIWQLFWHLGNQHLMVL